MGIACISKACTRLQGLGYFWIFQTFEVVSEQCFGCGLAYDSWLLEYLTWKCWRACVVEISKNLIPRFV